MHKFKKGDLVRFNGTFRAPPYYVPHDLTKAYRVTSVFRNRYDRRKNFDVIYIDTSGEDLVYHRTGNKTFHKKKRMSFNALSFSIAGNFEDKFEEDGVE